MSLESGPPRRPGIKLGVEQVDLVLLHHLNRLRGNEGNQNYPVPTTVGLQRPFTVLIRCRAFAVPIAAATIR
jgi:hypothetical protein